MGTTENPEVGDVIKITVHPDDNEGRLGRISSIKGDFYGIKFAVKPGTEATEFNYKRSEFEWHSADAR